ncbi:MAG: HEPN domain-containing protein [Nanoarchaeota archaeon]|nr:HEPN domain-containing protein [Nanoarchaeota archaeon]
MVCENKEEFKKWFLQSEADLDSARYNFDGEKYYVAVFLCEQSVEKALKALWLKDGNDLIKTHDLMRLGKKVGLPGDIEKRLEKLSESYINSRYCVDEGLIPAESFEKDEAEKFIKLTSEVLEWIKMKI